MNVYPGGKQAVMRDTKWNGEVQSMVLSDAWNSKGYETGITRVSMSRA